MGYTRGVRWNNIGPDEEAFIRLHVGIVSDHGIAARIGVEPSRISRFIRENDIRPDRQKPETKPKNFFTHAEDLVIKENLECGDWKPIARKLGRDHNSVRGRASRIRNGIVVVREGDSGQQA